MWGMRLGPIHDDNSDLEETGQRQDHRPEQEAQQHEPKLSKCFHDLTSILFRIRSPSRVHPTIANESAVKKAT